MLQEGVAGMMNLVIPIWASFVLKHANEKSFCYTSTLIVQHIALFFSDFSVNFHFVPNLYEIYTYQIIKSISKGYCVNFGDNFVSCYNSIV